jgi:hypothetical protein
LNPPETSSGDKVVKNLAKWLYVVTIHETIGADWLLCVTPMAYVVFVWSVYADDTSIINLGFHNLRDVLRAGLQ